MNDTSLVIIEPLLGLGLFMLLWFGAVAVVFTVAILMLRGRKDG